jgi:hypothetical protein
MRKVYPVLLLSSEQEEVFRLVEVEDSALERVKEESDLEGVKGVEAKLSVIFQCGQNGFQRVERRGSVSMGDVIFLDGEMHIVQRVGFMKITIGEVRELQRLPRRDRQFHQLVDPE